MSVAARQHHPSDASAGLPERIGPYSIVDVLGVGGMGVVYRAVHAATAERVALKTLAALAPDDLESLRLEIHALGRVHHPGLVRILAHGLDHGVPWYAMELLDGETLERNWRRDGGGPDGERVAPPRAVRERSIRLLRRLCATLGFLHGEGIVHRDLKPANVVIREDGEPVLVDFGLVTRSWGPLSREALEAAGAIVGTVDYMAPEQIRGEYVDARADLYAVGCMLYEAVTGRAPFGGASSSVVRQHLEHQPAPPSACAPDVPPALDALILRLLAKEPRARVGYADEVVRVLHELDSADGRREHVAPRSYLYRPSFAGRAEALSQITACLDRARERHGACVLIAGESGGGKTRLATEITRRATQRGFAVAAGLWSPVEASLGASSPGGSPSNRLPPLLAAVASQCGLEGLETTERILGRRGKVLAAYEPSLAGLPGQAEYPDPPELAPEAARVRLLSDLAETVASFAREVPTVLVLDDLQWADELTLAFLASLSAGFFDGTRLLILGTHRTEETSATLAALSRSPLFTRIELGGIETSAVASIVGDMLATSSAPARLVPFLARESEGNPFFVLEYLRTAVDSQLLRRDDQGTWRMAGGEAAVESLPLPRTLRELVGRRLEALGPAARTLLEAGAVLGRDFDLALAGAVADLDDARRLDAAAQLLGRHVVHDVDGRVVRFVHDKLREVTYAQIPRERVPLLHQAAATLIEARYGDEPELPKLYATLAHHWAVAGRAEKELEYRGKAGGHALRAGAHAEAHAFLTRALELDDGLGGVVARVERARWLRMLSDAAFGLGDLDASIRHGTAAVTHLGHRVPQGRSGSTALLVAELVRQARHRLLGGRRASVDADGRDADLEATLATYRLNTTYYYSGELVPSLAHLLRAVNLAEHAGVADGLTLAYGSLGYICTVAGLERLARRYFERAATLGGETGDVVGIGISLYLDGMHLLGPAAWERSRGLAHEAGELLATTGDRQETEVARTVLGHGYYYAGRFAEASEVFSTVLESARSRSHAQHVAWGLYTRARSLLALGRVEEALPLAEAGWSTWTPLAEIDRTCVLAEGVLASVLWSAGEHGRARETAGDLLRRLLEHPPPPIPQALDAYAGAAEVWLSAWAMDAADGECAASRRAARCATKALRRFARGFRMARPASLRCAARERWLLGRRRRALRLWARSVQLAAELAMPYDEALAHAELASVDRDEASHHHARATELFARLGCVPHPGHDPRLGPRLAGVPRV